LGEGSLLILGSNFAATPVAIPQQNQNLLFATSEAAGRAARDGTLEGYSTVALSGPQ
jgi:hypothetical protein